MKLIKVLSALLLLISSNSFSFSGGEIPLNHSDFELYNSSDLEEESHQVYDSHLSTYNYIAKTPSLLIRKDFGFCSSYFESLDNEYLFYSYLIIPSFGLDKILFPFHSFL